MSNKEKIAFPSCVRLTTKAQYRRVFDQPFRVRGQYWQVLIKDTGQKNARLGLAIAKKNLKRAVDRNTYKRIAREVFRLNQDSLANKDFVIMAKQKTLDKQALRLELLELLDLLKNT